MIEIKGYLLYSQQEDYKTKWIKPEDYSKVLCSNCKRILVENYFNNDVKVQKMKNDFLLVADGGNIFVSDRVRQFISDHNYQGVEMIKLDSMDETYKFMCCNFIEVKKELLDYSDKCEMCGEYISISAGKYFQTIKKKLYSTWIDVKVDDGFYFTDIKLGEHTQKAHDFLIGIETYNKMKRAKLKGFITIPLI